ncbi:PIN domain-like protein [Serendipita vermifera]|nr:PIN domain-like protein [Serendipita vermifera]
MRQKRAKAYRKLMAMYELSFGFRQPYQVLVDSEMCLSAQDHKIELVKQFETVLQGKVKPMITQCSMVELYKMGKERQPAVDMAKEFERRKCNHREAIDGSECMESVVGDKNKHRYVVASQSHQLRVKLRKVQAVPLVHIKQSVMVLEPPSDETLRVKSEMTEEGLKVPESEKQHLPTTTTNQAPLPIKKHKKAKGPNPLSVKKKKPKPQPQSSSHGRSEPMESFGKKRKREDDDHENAISIGENDDIKPKKKR